MASLSPARCNLITNVFCNNALCQLQVTCFNVAQLIKINKAFSLITCFVIVATMVANGAPNPRRWYYSWFR
jgi:hypothetical protein